MNFLFIEKNAHVHVYTNFFKLLLFYFNFFFMGSNVAPLFALFFFFSLFLDNHVARCHFFFPWVLMPTLAEKPNSRKKPNNMGGKELVN